MATEKRKMDSHMSPVDVLDRIVSVIASDPPHLSDSSTDGRVNSALSEKDVCAKIVRGFIDDPELRSSGYTPNVPKARAWQDIGITDTSNGLLVPINIKVSNLSGSDNLNCKLGIYYALTGEDPEQNGVTNGISYPCFMKRLSDGIKRAENAAKTSKKPLSEDIDYYFLIIDKNDPSKAYWTRLKEMSEIVPNGNNLPFQANWARNRKRVARTYGEARKLIMGTLHKSLIRRASVLDEYDRRFGNAYD